MTVSSSINCEPQCADQGPYCCLDREDCLQKGPLGRIWGCKKNSADDNGADNGCFKPRVIDHSCCNDAKGARTREAKASGIIRTAIHNSKR